ncbi:hypothetical protein BCR39DRAFT_87787 [Naematelia encephala]|uniref:Ser-Thr-rich glycosyl-phosphatidyl-inositol-anchored membrane family-domain-containing protein n=1 Tax=Naematelia encephala TaxID=71784 RepID=A0A1Y2BAY5_9TREE|nr:hypothetical protein BCR39DRAFT_87787 [Naematelia encephala]
MYPISLLLSSIILAIIPAKAVISIIYPGGDTIWYKNNTVALNWTTTSPDSDTYFFRALLSNTDQSLLTGNHSIADSTNATADYVRVLLPGIPEGKGYIVNLVNTTNENQVFATSPSFEIQNGIVTNSTSTSSLSGGTATGTSSTTNDNGDIPNAQPTSSSDPFATTTTSSDPFATATPSTSTNSAGSNVAHPSIIFALATSFCCVAMGLAVML